MKIFHISDTHGFHELLEIPEGIDMVIHSGDHSNYHDVYKNEAETINFLHWFANLKIKHKILIAGNHDALACLWNTKFKELCIKLNLIYLENSDVTIEGIKIWGSPYTPTFGDWHFMKARHKLDKVWQSAPDDTDIFVTHGPPKGILDLTYSFENNLFRCGCNALLKRLLTIKPILALFGHIHNNNDLINAGTVKLSIQDTIFSNGSVVTDGKFGKLSSNGNIFEL
jgi:Icc-related predicted phosphoesterase